MGGFHGRHLKVSPVQPAEEQTVKSSHKSINSAAASAGAETAHQQIRCQRRGFRTLLYPRADQRSLYVFGSEIAIEKERARQRETGKWVVHPLSPIRYYYVMFMVFLTVTNLVSIPLELAFTREAQGLVYSFWLGFNLLSDALFTIDIGLSFRMGILNDDSEVAILDLKTIRNEYAKTWLVPDVISAVSIDLIIVVMEMYKSRSTTVVGAGKLVRLIMFLRILSLIRLLRVSKLVRFFSEMEQVSDENCVKMKMFFRLTCLFMIMFLLCHWSGCIQYFVPYLDGFPADCWVVKLNLLNATVGEKYSFCMFRALSHMITISYGSNYPPTNEKEMWVVMVSMVSGVLMYTMLVANIAAMMTNTDAPKKAYESKINHLQDYMTYRKLPKALRHRINYYYQVRYKGKWFDENILSQVSKSLKEEILTVMCAELLRKAPLFQNRDMNFISAILLKLKYEIFLEGDIIIHENTPADRMFFIDRGQVIVDGEFLQKQLCDGDYFGEIALLTRAKRLATVRALSNCHLFSLSEESLHEVLHEFPNVMMDIERTAHQRCDDMENAEKNSSGLPAETELEG